MALVTSREMPALIEAVRVKFVDMAMDSLDEAPEIDDEMTFEVKAVCVGSGTKRMKDGELRRVVDMRVVALKPTSGPITPTGEPDLFAVADGDADGDDEDQGDELDGEVVDLDEPRAD